MKMKPSSLEELTGGWPGLMLVVCEQAGLWLCNGGSYIAMCQVHTAAFTSIIKSLPAA